MPKLVDDFMRARVPPTSKLGNLFEMFGEPAAYLAQVAPQLNVMEVLVFVEKEFF